MSVTASSTTASTLPPPLDLSSALAALQQAADALSAIVQQLTAQAGTGASAGAATLGGGGTGQVPGQGPGSGCGCCGGAGAVGGVEQLDQVPPAKGAKGAPEAPKPDKHKDKGKDSKGGGGPDAAEEMKKTSPGDDAGGGKGAQLVSEVRKYLGTKYVYGGESPSGFDCSGLMQYVAKKLGINLPRTASQQAGAGTKVDKKDLQPGDLVFFYSPVSHVGMYIGNGQMVNAPTAGDVVKVTDLAYMPAPTAVRRIV